MSEAIGGSRLRLTTLFTPSHERSDWWLATAFSYRRSGLFLVGAEVALQRVRAMPEAIGVTP